MTDHCSTQWRCGASMLLRYLGTGWELVGDHPLFRISSSSPCGEVASALCSIPSASTSSNGGDHEPSHQAVLNSRMVLCSMGNMPEVRCVQAHAHTPGGRQSYRYGPNRKEAVQFRAWTYCSMKRGITTRMRLASLSRSTTYQPSMLPKAPRSSHMLVYA